MDYFHPDLLFRPFLENSTFVFQVQIKFTTESSFCECKNVNWKVVQFGISHPDILFKVLVSHFDVILWHCFKSQPMHRYIDGVIL